jgi:hypothetical protein
MGQHVLRAAANRNVLLIGTVHWYPRTATPEVTLLGYRYVRVKKESRFECRLKGAANRAGGHLMTIFLFFSQAKMKQNAYCQTLCRKTYTAKQMEEFQVGTFVLLSTNARAILGARTRTCMNARMHLRASA